MGTCSCVMKVYNNKYNALKGISYFLLLPICTTTPDLEQTSKLAMCIAVFYNKLVFNTSGPDVGV